MIAVALVTNIVTTLRRPLQRVSSLGVLITLSTSPSVVRLSSPPLFQELMRDRQQSPPPPPTRHPQQSGLHIPSQNRLGRDRLWGSRGYHQDPLPSGAPGHVRPQSPWHEAGFLGETDVK